MSTPRYAPVGPVELVRYYESPEVVPNNWASGRPGEIQGRQPEGSRLGYQGPDQGYVITLAERARTRIKVSSSESVDDALRGCSLIALRRASIFGRAPAVHDLNLALGLWGFLSDSPPPDLVAVRRELFIGVGHVHHYKQGRALADMVPESTLRMTPDQVLNLFVSQWRVLTGYTK